MSVGKILPNEEELIGLVLVGGFISTTNLQALSTK